MNLRFVSIVVVCAAIATFMILQFTRESRATVLIPSELLKEARSGGNLSRIRVGGKVADMPIEYSVSPHFVLKFSIINPGKSTVAQPADLSVAVPVVYMGIKPSMFTVGRDVIIDGEFKDGVLQANQLLTQCPSKYEPPSPDKNYQKRDI